MAPRPPPSEADSSVDDWCERAAFVADDLDFLLGLDHHQFWSQPTFKLLGYLLDY